MPKPTPLDDHVDRLLASRTRQGLPRQVDDPAVLASVAALLGPAPSSTSAREAA